MGADGIAKGAAGADARGARRVARFSLGLLGAMVSVLVMVGPSLGAPGSSDAQVVALQTTASPSGSSSGSASPSPTGPAEPAIALLNPSQGTDPNFTKPPRPPDEPDTIKISDKYDGVDRLYHVTAWVKDAPSTVVVEAYIDPHAEFEGEVTVGLLDPAPGSTDTYEIYWDIPASLPEGDADLTVRLYEVTGTTTQEIAEDSVLVSVQHNDSINPQTGANTSPAEETVEITWPSSNGQAGFYKGRGGAWRTVVDGMVSAATVERVYVYYSTADPGSDPEYKSCSGAITPGTASGGASSWRGTCALVDKDTPSNVTAIAAVAAEDDLEKPAGLVPQDLTLESGDAHSVRPYAQSPGDMTIDVFPAPRSPHTSMAREVHTTSDRCLTFLARVRDQLDRPVMGANVDFHLTGPTDSVGFGEATDANGNLENGANKAPDKGGHTTEFMWDCDFVADHDREQSDTATGNVTQGETNVPGGPDIKHIESTAGSGLSAGNGAGAGEYRVYINADRPGFSDLTAWVDDEELPVESGNRDADSDLIEEGEPTDSYRAQWYSTAPTVQIDPTGGTAVTGTCQKYTVRVRSGSAAVPDINLDIHATGPDDQLDFCDVEGSSPREAPDKPDPSPGPAHEPEEEDEAAHSGASPKAQHTEGNTDEAGNFVFGITSPVAGDTNIQAWIDKEPGFDNDVQDADEPSGSARHTWGASLADATVRFVNPSGYGGSATAGTGGDQISNKLDADQRYHLVARTDAAGVIPGVEFLISSDGTTFTSIGAGTRVGESDTYELYWDSNSMADAAYTLRVQIVGTTKFEDRTVTVNNDDSGATPAQQEFAFETAELSRPLNGEGAPFTKSSTPVSGVASASADAVVFYYTKTSAGTARPPAAWVQCGRVTLSTNATAPQPFSGSCTLAAADQASQVTGIAAIATDCNRSLGCPSTTNPAGSESNDSGDAHRVFGFDAAPLISIEPAEAEKDTGECQRFDLRVVDQTGQAIASQNIDIHLQGPTDGASYCDPGDGSTRSSPDGGSHAAESEDGQTGVHEDAEGNDIKHTEGTTGSSGRFVFGVRSEAEGDSVILAWVDTAENDEQDSGESSDTSTVHWVSKVDGGGGSDRCTIRGTQGDDELEGTSGDDVICGRGGDDVIRAKGGNDIVRAGFGKDVVRGGSGSDNLQGRQGSDKVFGGKGADTLKGGRGNDRLDGGPGRQDACSGGPGRDTLTRCE